MAVPGGRNGLRDGDDGEGLWPDEDDLGEVVQDYGFDDVPPHLRAVAYAAEKGDSQSIRNALDCYSFHIDEPLEDGDTALHLCCLYGHLSCVQLLVERGANIEVKDEDGALPLHDACAGGSTQIVEYLLSIADSECIERMLNTGDVEGDTPLHCAARGEHAGPIRVLLALGASATKENVYGKIPADLADPGTEGRMILDAWMRR